MLSILTSPTSPLYLDTPIYIKVNTYLGTPPTTTIPCCHHALSSIGAPFYLLIELHFCMPLVCDNSFFLRWGAALWPILCSFTVQTCGARNWWVRWKNEGDKNNYHGHMKCNSPYMQFNCIFACP